MAVVIDYGHLWSDLRDLLSYVYLMYDDNQALHIVEFMDAMEKEREENARRILTRSRVSKEVKDDG